MKGFLHITNDELTTLLSFGYFQDFFGLLCCWWAWKGRRCRIQHIYWWHLRKKTQAIISLRWRYKGNFVQYSKYKCCSQFKLCFNFSNTCIYLKFFFPFWFDLWFTDLFVCLFQFLRDILTDKLLSVVGCWILTSESCRCKIFLVFMDFSGLSFPWGSNNK